MSGYITYNVYRAVDKRRKNLVYYRYRFKGESINQEMLHQSIGFKFHFSPSMTSEDITLVEKKWYCALLHGGHTFKTT